LLEMKQRKALEEWQEAQVAAQSSSVKKIKPVTDVVEKEEELAEDDDLDIQPEAIEEEDETLAPGAEETELQDSGPAEVELSPEETEAWFHPVITPDMTAQSLSRSLLNFSLPGADERFDEISYDWQNAEKSQEFLRSQISKLKLTMVFDHIVASVLFKELYAKWQKAVADWQAKMKIALFKEYKAKQQTSKVQKAKTDEVGESAAEEADQAEDAPAAAGTVDIFEVQDICDVGDGRPLFVNFKSEDWELMHLRYELFLMMHIFKK